MKIIKFFILLMITSMSQAQTNVRPLPGELISLPYGSQISFIYQNAQKVITILLNEEDYELKKIKDGFEVTFLGAEGECSYLSVNLINYTEDYYLCTKAKPAS